MDPDTKSVICRALRSGRYVQGPEFQGTDGSCCVGGVVVDVYRRMHSIRLLAVTEGYGKAIDIAHFLAWMGLTDSQMDRFADETESLNASMTFPEIADVIEAKY